VSLGAPVYLAALLLPVLAVAAYLWAERRPSRYAVSYPNLAVLAGVASGRGQSWKRHATAGLLAIALALLCVAVARPHMALTVPSERATVVLALDLSGSMGAEDVKPNRLDAAKAAIRGFLDRLPDQVRVGLVLFSSEPYLAVPPTRDREAVSTGLDFALPQFGTSIGDSVARSAQVARDAIEGTAVDGEEAPEAAPPAGATEGTETDKPLAQVVFLSDGFQTRGVLSPEEGAQRAKEAGVPVHTVALGTDSGVIRVERYGEQRVIPVPPDRVSLASIAEITGGEAFDVRDAERLSDVYARLGSAIGRVEEEREVTAAFVGAGAVALSLAGLLAGLWAPRLP
jgi:Ca-activated chloride channel family protein